MAEHSSHSHLNSAHDHDADGHAHAHHAPASYDRAFAIGLILNIGFVVVELGFGLLANSIALIADAGHNLSDVLGLVLAWGATLLARRQPSRRHTYGWRKSSILAAFLNAVFLLVATGAIAWESIQRFWQSGSLEGETIIGVAAIGIAINTLTALMFLSGRQGDMNIRAAFLHMAADAMVSLGVVLAGVLILYTGWFWVDPASSLVISALIIFNTWDLLKDSFNLAIDAVPRNIDERAVRLYLQECSGVAQVHDLHIWAMSTTETALTAHLVMPGGHPGDEFLAQLSQALRGNFGIAHATIQIEMSDLECSCHLAGDRSH